MAEQRLTPQQQAVVDDRGGTLLVSAAAGSGKTKVLVDRVLSRILHEGRNINEFLIITFTNAAAAELRGKIASAISAELAKDPGNRHLNRQMDLLHLSQISTVHAFCGALIRQYGYLLEVPADYRMLEDSERTDLLNQVLEQVLDEAYEKGEEDFRLLANTLGAGRTDQALVELIQTMFDTLQSQPYPQKWLRQQQVSILEDTELTDTLWGRLLVEDARQKLQWTLERYDWAISVMEQDELLQPKYLPCYKTQRAQLRGMLAALEGPWAQIGPSLVLDQPRVSVRAYPDQDLLNELKAVKSDSKDLTAELSKIFTRPAAELIREQNRLAPALRALIELVSRLDKRFTAEKRRKNLLDFSDQEHLAIRLLVHPERGTPTETAREVSSRFCEIMVDEYQDSNRVQELIFTSISDQGDSNRFLVGDVKQSIYGFRQAEPGIFLEKYRRFAPASDAQPGSPRKLVLSRNFRSRPEILSAVNQVFSSVMSEAVGDLNYGPEERLYPGLPEYPAVTGPCVELHVLELQKSSDQEETKYQREAQWVACRIAKLLKDQVPIREDGTLRPVRPEDIAILFRSRDAISTYARVLTRAGIPVASDTGENLFEAPEVKVLVDLLRVLNNPHQDIPLLAVLCSPVFRLSNDQLSQVRSQSRQSRFYDAMRECGEPWCQRALEKLEQLRTKAAELSADALVWLLLHETGLLAAYSAMENGQSRRENLLAVYQLARKTAAGDHLFLYQLLKVLDRTAEAGTMTSAVSAQGVVLTTMHKSKGLEYPVVILADLARRFNFRELQKPVLFDSDAGIGAKITDTDLRIRYPGLCYDAIAGKKRRALLSEELRILYVAMTRPKDYLIMTYTSEYTSSAIRRLRAGAGTPAEPWCASNVSCLGDWVLLAALGRIESGALFEVCGRPKCQLHVSDYPWQVTYEPLERVELPQNVWLQAREEEIQQTIPSPEQMKLRLQWQDPNRAASQTPSKLTATQLKGRDKDTEAAEGARVSARVPQLRRPEFILEKRGLSPTEKGTAVHLFLQYADFGRCTDVDGVISEMDRLVDDLYITEQQAQAVQPDMVSALFRLPLGQRILTAKELIREYKFSILTDAATFYPDVEGEQVLLQGVVDAAILEEDGLTVIDFKTDRVTADDAYQRAEIYRGQLETYRMALERIFGRPVKEMILYFLTPGKAVIL